MSDDLLDRATRALRETTDAGGPAPGAGRRRVIDGVRARQRAAARRTAVLVPLAALLVTSTAIAAASGALPGVWQAVRQVLAPADDADMEVSAPAAEPRPARQAGGTRRARPAAASGLADAAPTPSQPTQAAPIQEVAPQPMIPAVPAAAELRPVRPLLLPAPRVAQPGPRSTVAPAAPAQAAQPALQPLDSQGQRAVPAEPLPTESAPAPALEAAPGAAPVPPGATDALTQFRHAQRLQFRDHDWAAALAAWGGYLREAPRGELAPEARWNRALCLLRLGRNAEARRALEPFATGAEGGYRQAEAKALLDALEDGPQP